VAEALYDHLGAAVTRWTMGGAAASVAPPGWAAHLGTDPGEAELRLLALSGQFLGVLVTPEPPGDLTILPDVPPLALPALPEALRPLARRILRAAREGRASRDLLRFLAARGHTLHPGDWMPAAGEDDIPDVYAAWRDWAQGSVAPAGRGAEADLTAETWPDYWPAARNVAFAALRRSDPAAATALLAAKLAGENADARLRLVAMLAARLSDADRPFLESLAADRAPKVKALAASLLARLGHGPAVGEEAVELAAFFELQTKGLLRRTRIVAARALKTPAQRTRRHALFETVDLAAFAQTLGIPAADLIAMWPWTDDRQADHGLIAMAERSGSDGLVAALHETLVGLGTVDVPAMLTLLPRLDPAQRRGFAQKLLRAGGGSFQMALAISGGDCPVDGAIDSVAGLALLAALKTDETARRTDLTAELHAVGLVASRPAAQAALDRLARAGLLAADPRLDMLRLNAALEDRGTR
jgi:hypothetical protein